MDSLADTDLGTFAVDTASGTRYELDTVARTALRVPRTNEPATHEPADLRKDGTAVVLVSIASCTLGLPLTLILGAVDNYDGYGGTVRRATPVTAIERLS